MFFAVFLYRYAESMRIPNVSTNMLLINLKMCYNSMRKRLWASVANTKIFALYPHG